MRIYNNVSAVNSQNQLDANTRMMGKSLERLSTGLRINRSADDAAGLSVSEGLRSQIRGSQMAQRNADDASAMLQVAESGSQQIVDSLQRMRELAIQSANGTYSNQDREYIQNEFDQLTCEISRIGNSTTYNGVALLNSSSTTFTFQVSAAASGTASSSTISFQSVDLAQYGVASKVGTVETQAQRPGGGGLHRLGAELGAEPALGHRFGDEPPGQDHHQPGQHGGQHHGCRKPHPGRGLRDRDHQVLAQPDPHAVLHQHAGAGQPAALGSPHAPEMKRAF